MHPDFPQRILYLEDNSVDADLVRIALARHAPEASLEIAPSLAQALRLLAPEMPPYDLVLSDLRLADGSGLELLAHIRERRLPLAVIILTGSGDQSSAIAALKAGADDYLVKRDDYCNRLMHTLPAALARFRIESANKSRPLRVLYAEHNIFDKDLACRHFSQHAPQIRLDVVDSGTEILAVLPQSSADPCAYDVLLLDYQMPGLNALEIVKILRDERGLHLPVVIVSGQGSEDVVAEALRMGVADYLLKRTGYLTELPPILEHAHRQAQLLREQAALRTTSARLHQLLAANPTILYVVQVEGQRMTPIWISENITRIFGYTMDECMAPGWWQAGLHPDDREHAMSESLRLLTEYQLSHEYRFCDKSGTIHWVRDEMRLLCDAAGNPREVVGSWNDISATHQADERQKLQAAALHSTRDAVMITDLDANILSINPAFTEITGYDEAEVIGKNARILQSERQDHLFFQTMWASLNTLGQWQGEIWNRRKNADIYPQWLTISAVRDTHGSPTHYVAVMTDLTTLKRSEEQADRLAHFDPLTDLPNRLLLRSLLQRALEKAERQKYQVAVLFVNLDKFKTINDSLGHASGDQLLLGVTERLNQRFNGEHLIARLSGDEFVVVLDMLDEAMDAEIVASDLMMMLESPFTLADGHEVYARASIGISIYPQDGDSAQDLLHCADAATHRAKEQGGNQFAFYTSELSARALTQLEMEAGLRRALPQQEFVLHYQPKVDLVSGKITGAEALLRWQRPGFGMVPPFDFIPITEKNGLIVAIGAWVIDEACRQIRSWNDEGLIDVKIAVNVSTRQFRSPELEAVITAALARHQVLPQQLTLELTESMLMEAPAEAIERLHGLKRIGVQLSLDDFGTGYSSLAYLSRFPVDQLKIDRSFVIDVVTDPSAANIATSIIALAHRMQLKVVAEGVETDEQMDYLRKNQCDEMQGYLFSKPVPPEQFATLMRQGKALKLDNADSTLRILLIVEPDPEILTALQRALGGQGYRIFSAGSAREGLELLGCHAAQVILADQQLPDMNGLEFLKWVKTLYPESVRLLLSDLDKLDTMTQATDDGVLYKFVPTPWGDEQLQRQLHDAFKHYLANIQAPAAAKNNLTVVG